MGQEPLILTSTAPAQTEQWGRLLGTVLQGGDCVALVGELGAGKTAFARGVGAGLGVPEPLRSPSYLLCCEHSGRVRVLHLDAYFDRRLGALLEEGLAARFGPDAAILVEWADRLAAWWPADRLEIRLEPAEGQPEGRRLCVQALGPRSAAVLELWRVLLEPAPAPRRSEPPPPLVR